MDLDSRRVGLWKLWWPLGAVVLAGVIVTGIVTAWSASLWAAAGVVALVYLGVPGTAAALHQLGDSEQAPAVAELVQSNIDMGQGPEMSHAMAAPPDRAPRPTKTTRLPGGAVIWDQRLNPVVRTLAGHLRRHETIDTIGTEAGLAMQYVNLTGNAPADWHRLFERALDQDMVDSLLEEALKWTADKDVHATIAEYRRNT
jgi:hypothetical protein